MILNFRIVLLIFSGLITNVESEGYGPRVIVRSIKRIKKGERVTVTYTDLLQPKVSLFYVQMHLSRFRIPSSEHLCFMLISFLIL